VNHPRWLGRHPLTMRRAVLVAVLGLVVAVVLVPFVVWGIAVVAGWNAAALAFLGSVWPVMVRADGQHTERLARREDEPRGSAAVLLIVASVVSLLGAGFVLVLAGQRGGAARVLLSGLATLTVAVSWAVLKTLFTLR